MPSIKQNDSSFFENISQITQLLFKNRNHEAVRVPNIRDHQFFIIGLKELTHCSQCGDLIWLTGQSCKLCKLVSHNRCLKQIESYCSATSGSKTRLVHANHKFKETFFMSPTFCHHCGTLLVGITGKQGLECELKSGGCGMKVHRECKLLIGQGCDRNFVSRRNSAIKDCQRLLGIKDQSSHQWSKVSIRDFELIGFIGKGSFSKVYLAKLRTNQEKFAIKVTKKTTLGVSIDPESVFAEIRVFQCGRQHPFLASAHCCFQDETRLFVVMEYIQGRDLAHHIHQLGQRFSEERAKYHAAEIVLAVKFLHQRGVVHRDIKLENVILDQDGHCKILDFGMARELNRAAYLRASTFCGTPPSISPEMIRGCEYGFSVDWWSLGVMMYEMLVGESPFESDNLDMLYKSIVNDEVHYPMSLSKDAESVLRGFLAKDPEIRLGCNMRKRYENEILEHSFFMFQHPNSCTSSHQWDAIEDKSLKPTFRIDSSEQDEAQVSGESELSLTPLSSDQLKGISQKDFEKFSYYSKSFESRLQAR